MNRIYNIMATPVAKPRMTRSDMWNKRDCVIKYWSYKDEVQKQFLVQKIPIVNEMGIRFYLPMPKGWVKKKREEMNLKPHQVKPDLDNLLKGFLDAIIDQDQTVHNIKWLQKVWINKPEGEIEITI